MYLKKYFLTTLVLALSFGALMGVYVLIFEDFGELQSKILFTTLSFGGFSITGLCASIWHDKRKFLFLSYCGMVTSILGFLYSFLLIWEIIDEHLFDFEMLKPLLVLIILSVALAHACLILLVHKKSSLLTFVLTMTFVCTSVISLMLIGMIIWEWKVKEPFFRTLGVLAILGALGTISLPILNKIDLLNSGGGKNEK